MATMVASLSVLIVSSQTWGAAGGAIAWQTNYETAKATAQSSQKILLVNIHATWCIPCKKLMSGTLSDPELGNEIMQNCIPLSLDADQDAAVIRQWPITGFPTQLFIAPDGQVLNTIVGNVPVATYRSALSKVVQTLSSSGIAARPNRESPATQSATPTTRSEDVVNRPTHQSLPNVASLPAPPIGTSKSPMAPGRQPMLPPALTAANDPATGRPATPPASPAGIAANAPKLASPMAGAPTTQQPAAMPSESAAVPPPRSVASQVKQKVINDKNVRPCDMSVPLALDGYCPVSMFKRSELIRGADTECCVYNEKRYHFLSSVEKEMFLKNPRRYLPAEEGYCVVTWAEKHSRALGNVELPALFGDYLFLFANDDARQKFLQDPEHYVDATGHAHRIPKQTYRGDRNNVR
jgi:YHS domain-containing protein/thiol-disulfide isomerase/thioredoxin